MAKKLHYISQAIYVFAEHSNEYGLVLLLHSQAEQHIDNFNPRLCAVHVTKSNKTFILDCIRPKELRNGEKTALYLSGHFGVCRAQQ